MEGEYTRNTSRGSRMRDSSRQAHSVHDSDWKIFMWLASLKEIENLIYLFIVTWNAFSLCGRNQVKFSQEFTEETSKMIQFIEKLPSLRALNNERKEMCIKALDSYKNCRLEGDNKLRNELVNNAWIELENCGLYNSYIFADQLEDCTIFQKESLRKMISSRMEFFRSFAEQIQENKEKEQHSDTQDINDIITNTPDERSEIDKSKQENIRLTAQLADVEWCDRDKNNSTRLVKDIEALARALDKTIEVKRNAEIKYDAVAELFSSLKCTTKENQMKLTLNAALQQHSIKFILKSADSYFEHAPNDVSEVQIDKLEASILSKTEELIKLTTRFEKILLETDEHSQLSTKLRQQNYAALGHHVFSGYHPFINQLARDLIDEMNKYRILDSEEKIKKFEKEITTFIIQFLRIFYFRLKTQEPIPSMEFYESGKTIDPNFMDGVWEGHYEDYVVEICSFPAVLVRSDDEKVYIYTKAQVIARPRNELDHP